MDTNFFNVLLTIADEQHSIRLAELEEYVELNKFDAIADMLGLDLETILKIFTSFKQAQGQLNEGLTKIKRQWTEAYPAVFVNKDAIMRNKIVEFIGENGCTYEEFRDFCKNMSEDAEIGKSPNPAWLSQNKKIVRVVEVGKKKYIRLTELGKRILEMLNNKEINELKKIKKLKIDDLEVGRKYLLNSDSTTYEYVGDGWLLNVDIASRSRGQKLKLKDSDSLKLNESKAKLEVVYSWDENDGWGENKLVVNHDLNPQSLLSSFDKQLDSEPSRFVDYFQDGKVRVIYYVTTSGSNTRGFDVVGAKSAKEALEAIKKSKFKNSELVNINESIGIFKSYKFQKQLRKYGKDWKALYESKHSEKLLSSASKLKDFFRSSTKIQDIADELKKLKYDDKLKPISDVSKLTKMLNSTSDEGTKLYIAAAFRSNSMQLGDINESKNIISVSALKKALIKETKDDGNVINTSENFKELKSTLQKLRKDRSGGYFKEFSTYGDNDHRGNFRFHDDFVETGRMLYTGSGNPKSYIDRLNKDLLNNLGYQMIDDGNRVMKIQKMDNTNEGKNFPQDYMNYCENLKKFLIKKGFDVDIIGCESDDFNGNGNGNFIINDDKEYEYEIDIKDNNDDTIDATIDIFVDGDTKQLKLKKIDATVFQDKFNNFVLKFIKDTNENLNEGKNDGIYLPNSNLLLLGSGRDTNGNKIVKLKFPSTNGFSIQTNNTTKETQYLMNRFSLDELSDSQLEIIEREVVSYIRNFGSAMQKSKLKLYKGFNENKTLDFSQSQKRDINESLYESASTVDEVESILKQFGIKNYKINPDLTVDVNGDVNLAYKKLTKLPVKFGKVTGDFFCQNNQLASLEGSPTFVGRDFICYNNKLITLEGGPTDVGRDYICGANKLVSLEGGPKSVGRDFTCDSNEIISLEGGPKNVGGHYWCHNNKLTTLKGSPTKIGKSFWCNNNKLTTLEGGPKNVGEDFYCNHNKLTTLEGSPTSVGRRFWCDNNELISLKGSPTNIPGNFYCYNNQLVSLKGAPKSVGGDFYCYNNSVKFTKADVKAVTNVGGKIKINEQLNNKVNEFGRKFTRKDANDLIKSESLTIKDCMRIIGNIESKLKNEKDPGIIAVLDFQKYKYGLCLEILKINEDTNSEIQDWKADLVNIKNRQKSESENFQKQFQNKKMTTKDKLDLAKLKLKHAQEMVKYYSDFPGDMNEGLTTDLSRRLQGLYKISSTNGGKDNYNELKKIGVGGEFNYLGNLATVTKIENDKIVAVWHGWRGDRVMNIDKNGEITTGVLKSNTKINKNGELVESASKELQISNEKAVSKSQQRLFGMAKALKSGDMKISDIKPEYREDLKNIIDTMTMKQISDFAKTKHKGLPDKVEEAKIKTSDKKVIKN